MSLSFSSSLISLHAILCGLPDIFAFHFLFPLHCILSLLVPPPLHTHAYTRARKHTLTHTHTHSLSLSFSLSRTHIHTHTRTRAHTHTTSHIHSDCLCLSVRLSLFLSPSFSLARESQCHYFLRLGIFPLSSLMEVHYDLYSCFPVVPFPLFSVSPLLQFSWFHLFQYFGLPCVLFSFSFSSFLLSLPYTFIIYSIHTWACDWCSLCSLSLHHHFFSYSV